MSIGCKRVCIVVVLFFTGHAFGVSKDEFLAEVDAQFQEAAKSEGQERFRPPSVKSWRTVERLIENAWRNKIDIPLHDLKLQQLIRGICAIEGFGALSYSKFYVSLNAQHQEHVRQKAALAAQQAVCEEVPRCCFCSKRKHEKQRFLKNGCCSEGHGCFDCYLKQYFIKNECSVCRRGFSWHRVTRVLIAHCNRQKFHKARAAREKEIDEENEANLARALAESLSMLSLAGGEDRMEEDGGLAEAV